MNRKRLATSLLIFFTGCISSDEIKGYGWEDIKGTWTLQGVYSIRGTSPCLDHSDPYFYHSNYTPDPIPYCRINYQASTYSINYPEFNVFLQNEEHDGVIRYDSHSTDSGFFDVKFSNYLIDPVLGKRFLKDTTQLFELGTFIHDSSPNDTLHLLEGSNQNILNVLVRK